HVRGSKFQVASDPMQTDSSLPEPGFIFHTYFTPTHFLHCVHMNPVNPIDSAVVHPPRLLVALWCYRQLKKTEKKTGACYQNNMTVVELQLATFSLAALPTFNLHSNTLWWFIKSVVRADCRLSEKLLYLLLIIKSLEQCNKAMCNKVQHDMSVSCLDAFALWRG